MGAPPFVFVVLDGTRKDRLSLYGHDRETSPNLEAFASEAVVFENAFTPAPWSLPAHTSMFTGLYPSEHGLTNVFAGEPFGSPEQLDRLAARLSEQGYRTGGFSANPWVGQHTGLDDGFDCFVEWDLEASSVPADWSLTRRERIHSRLHTVFNKASQQPLALLKDGFFSDRLFSTAARWATHASSPTYTFLNVMASHTPYYPSRSAFDALGLDRPSLLEPRLLNATIVRNQLRGEGTAVSRTERIREYYDSTIRTQDERLGRFLDRLRADNTYDESLIVVTADHGKTLGEFDRDGTPAHTIQDINVNVPLVVKFPYQNRPRRLTDPFSLVDIGELFLTDDPTPSLAAELTSRYALIEDYLPHTASEPQEVSQWRALTDGTYKYVLDDSGEEFLLEGAGPAESLTDDRERLRAMRDAFETEVTALDDHAVATPETETLNEDVESRLREIGYLN